VTNDYNGAKISIFETSFVNMYKQEMLFTIPWKENVFHRPQNPKLFAMLEHRCLLHKDHSFTLKDSKYHVDGDTATREKVPLK
jgi:hypothetical protein